MQKWLPEPFQLDEHATSGLGSDGAAFEPDAVAKNVAAGVDEASRMFRKESGFTDSATLMSQLTQEERSLVYELVELDLNRNYEKREAALKAQQAADLEVAKSGYEDALRSWAEGFGAEMTRQVDQDVHEIAVVTARLAVQLAEKIVRATAAVDHEVLVRVLETTLYKVDDPSGLVVVLNPDDAAYMSQHPDLCRKLNISEIAADRRISSGGCRVRAAGREWDATIERQLETLGELVEEMIATGAVSRGSEPTPEPEESPATPFPVPPNEASSTDVSTPTDGETDEPGLD